MIMIMIINTIMSLLSRSDCEDRFQLYLDKTFNKTVRIIIMTFNVIIIRITLMILIRIIIMRIIILFIAVIIMVLIRMTMTMVTMMMRVMMTMMVMVRLLEVEGHNQGRPRNN